MVMAWLRSLFRRAPPAPPAPWPPCDLLNCGQAGNCPWCGVEWCLHESVCVHDPLGEDPAICDACGNPADHRRHVTWEHEDALRAAWERWVPGTRELPEVK